MHARGAAPDDFDADLLAQAVQTIRDRERSYAGYLPGRVAAPLTLFRATGNSPRHEAFFAPLGERERETLGWSRHAGGPVEVHAVPGEHVTIGAEPHVRVLVQHMREALAAARERARTLAPALRP